MTTTKMATSTDSMRTSTFSHMHTHGFCSNKHLYTTDACNLISFKFVPIWGTVPRGGFMRQIESRVPVVSGLLGSFNTACMYIRNRNKGLTEELKTVVRTAIFNVNLEDPLVAFMPATSLQTSAGLRGRFESPQLQIRRRQGSPTGVRGTRRHLRSSIGA